MPGPFTTDGRGNSHEMTGALYDHPTQDPNFADRLAQRAKSINANDRKVHPIGGNPDADRAGRIARGEESA